MDKPDRAKPESTEFQNFQELLDKLLTARKDDQPIKPPRKRKRKTKPQLPNSAQAG